MVWHGMQQYLENNGAELEFISTHSKFTITWKSKPWWVADSYVRIDNSKVEFHVCNGIPFILTIWVKSGKMVIGFGVQFMSAQNVCQNELQCECICGCNLCKSKYMTNT